MECDKCNDKEVFEVWEDIEVCKECYLDLCDKLIEWEE